VVVKTVFRRLAGRYAAGMEVMKASTSLHRWPGRRRPAPIVWREPARLTAADFQLSVAQSAQARSLRLRYTL